MAVLYLKTILAQLIDKVGNLVIVPDNIGIVHDQAAFPVAQPLAVALGKVHQGVGGYVAGWSSGKELSELKASLETIRATANDLITKIDGHLAQLQQERQARQDSSMAMRFSSRW